MSSGVETLEADSQELCSWPYPLLLDEILESSPVPMTVEYLLYFPLHFSVDDYGRWVVFRSLSCDRVFQGRSKLHYVEHWIELLHPVWQF